MSLPASYRALGPNHERRTRYFEDVVTFLKSYQWIYNFPNTDVLIENVFDKFPPGWRRRLEELDCRELNEIPFGFYREDWPEDLKRFVCSVQSLKPRHEVFQSNASDDVALPKSFSKGLNPKKQHEIRRLAKVVHEYCRKEGITTVIDVGAGLGYLSHLLHELYKYKVVAIESETVRFNSAIRRQDKYHSTNRHSVRYFQHYVGANSAVEIDGFLQGWYDDGRAFDEPTCLIGLHACADLTVTAFDIFVQLKYIKLAIVMPCCYHKLAMNVSGSTGERRDARDTAPLRDSLKFSHESREPECFYNFPLSASLAKSYGRHDGSLFLKRSFLRVACQSSASVWREMSAEEHRWHSVSHMRRAVLQLYTIQEKYALVKLKRKCMNRYTSSNCDFDTYLTQLDQGYYLVPQDDVSCTPGGFCKAYGTDASNANAVRDENFTATTTTDNRNVETDLEVSSRDDNVAVSNVPPGNRLTFTAPDVQSTLTTLWRKYEPLCPLIEILTCLQNSVQAICENLILLDRVTYVEERSPDVKCNVIKVTEDDISPRCHALIALKSAPGDTRH